MKKTKIVIPALGLLLLSTAASVSGTVAWFSANTSVKVNGMAVTTKVSGNLLIASSNTNDDMYAASDLTQTVTGIVEPSSSIDGIDFYYTKDNVKGSGAATMSGDTGKSVFAQYSTSAAATDTATYDNAFDEYYEVAHSVPYVDYVFYLKATSSAAGQKVILSKVNLTYNNLALANDETAWRTAMFCEPVIEGAAGGDAVVGNHVTTLAPAGAVNFTAGQAVDSLNASNNAVLGSVLHKDAAALIGTLSSAGQTQRYKVIVRMWLEGEDTTCSNETFATLTLQYKLDLAVKLVDSANTEAVTAIGSVDL